MNRIKTFDQYENLSEEFKDLRVKIMEYLNNPTDEELANKLLQKSFFVQFGAKATKPYEKMV